MHTCFGTFDVGYAPSDYVCTNGIVPRNHSDATQESELYLRN